MWGLTTLSRNSFQSNAGPEQLPRRRQKGKSQEFSSETCKGHMHIWPFLLGMDLSFGRRGSEAERGVTGLAASGITEADPAAEGKNI